MKYPPGKYYLQDRRTVCGNSMMWWGKDRVGYFPSLDAAHVFDADDLNAMGLRETDRPWPKEYIDRIAGRHVDVQVADYDASEIAESCQLHPV